MAGSRTRSTLSLVLTIVVAAIVFVGWPIVSWLAHVWTDYLWFDDLGQRAVFITRTGEGRGACE